MPQNSTSLDSDSIYASPYHSGSVEPQIPLSSVLDSVILPYMVKFSEAISYMIWPEPWSYHMRLI